MNPLTQDEFTQAKLAVMNVIIPGFHKDMSLGELYGEAIIEKIVKVAWNTRWSVHEEGGKGVEVRNLLHQLNLDRADIRELPEGATIACNITTLRKVADYLRQEAPNHQPSAHQSKQGVSLSKVYHNERLIDLVCNHDNTYASLKEIAQTILDAAGVIYVD